MSLRANASEDDPAALSAEEAEESGDLVVGVIAQDVQRALPEAVAESKRHDMLAVNYFKLVPVVVEALKGVHARFKAQSADPQYLRSLRRKTLRKTLRKLVAERNELDATNERLEKRLAVVEERLRRRLVAAE